MKSKEEMLAMAVEVVKATKGKRRTASIVREVFEQIKSLTKEG